MADFVDRIKLIFDADASGATKEVKSLRREVSDADGPWNKLKTAAGGAFDMIGSAGPAAVAGAGAAIAVAAFKMASGFQDAVLAANDFAQATGLTIDQASRWQEVADDVGVSTQDLEGAINKLNLAAAKGTLADLGIDGESTNEQLLNALTHLQGIDSASQRAAEGAKIFGKSWQSLAPLVESSGDLRANLAAVSDQQAFDDKDVQQAKHFRDSLDELQDTLTRLQNALGSALLEPIADLMNGFGNLIDTADSLSSAIPGVSGALDLITSPLRNVTDGFNTLTDSSNSLADRARGLGQSITGAIPGPLGSWAAGMFDVEDAQQAAEAATKATNEAAKAQAEAAKEAEDALKSLVTATLSSFNSQLGLADAADSTTEAIAKYQTAQDTASASSYGNAEANKAAAKAQNDAEQAALKQAAAAAKLADDQAKANGVTLSAAESASVQANALRQVAGTLDPNSPLAKSLNNYIAQLESIPAKKSTEVDANTAPAEQKLNSLQSFFNRMFGGGLNFNVHANATTSGTPATAGTQSAGVTRTSGEPGAPAPTTSVVPRGATGPTVINNVYVQAHPLLTNPADIGKAVSDVLDAFYRRNGTRTKVAA